jgi:hypothetical protein
MKRPVASLMVVLLTLLASACKTEEATTGAGTSDLLADASADAGIVCDDRYAGVSDSGKCDDVPGAAGRWSAEPLFADVPPESGSCRYTWSGDDGAPADWRTLSAHIALWTLAPACESSSDGGAGPTLSPRSQLSDPHNPVGAVGCDVCGFQKDGKIWVIIPPNVLFREVAVPLSNGKDRAFSIEGAGTSRFFSVDLPAPPRGTTYVDGHVFVQ